MGVAKHFGISVVSFVLTIISYAYMTMVRVPSVLEIRPELADVGFVTGVFGGRGTEYLWMHFPIPMAIITLGLVMISLELFSK